MTNIIVSESYTIELKLIKTIRNRTFFHASLPVNLDKNRSNHLCYDHSRVILSTKGESSDYHYFSVEQIELSQDYFKLLFSLQCLNRCQR
jgi:hypothetical protein